MCAMVLTGRQACKHKQAFFSAKNSLLPEFHFERRGLDPAHRDGAPNG
jgi:hypothetical protein